MRKTLWILSIATSLAGCAHDEAARPAPETPASAKVELPEATAGSTSRANALLSPKSGNTTLRGQADFTQTPDGVRLTLKVKGVPSGEHGAHIHEKGDCSDPEAKNAGIHWNPAGHKHGAPPPGASHLGDLGNIQVDAEGNGQLELITRDWSIGSGAADDVVGKSIVIHADVDDLATDPAGNSGARIGCGVIE